MNATRSRTRAGRRLVATLAGTASVLALSTAALAPPASAAAGELAGTWTSVDIDGSNQTLEVRGAGNPYYSIFYRDDVASVACDGAPAALVGRGVAEGTALNTVGTLLCFPGGNPIPGIRIDFNFEYDAATDTLTDSSGVVWERAD